MNTTSCDGVSERSVSQPAFSVLESTRRITVFQIHFRFHRRPKRHRLFAFGRKAPDLLLKLTRGKCVLHHIFDIAFNVVFLFSVLVAWGIIRLIGVRTKSYEKLHRKLVALV